MLFAIPWTAFAVFWMVMAAQGSTVFALFGVPFVAVGLGMLSSPYWVRKRARRTGYAITTDRALIVAPSGLGGGMSVRSYGPAELGEMERVERADGSGDLVFSRELLPRARSGGTAQATERRVGFIAVPAVREVQIRLEELRRSAARSGGGGVIT